MTREKSWLDPKSIVQFKALPLRARKVMQGFLMGLHRSPYRGSSVEFAEYREYLHGDPVKNIDWKVYGRTDHFYVKHYEDETNLKAHLLLDISGSMFYDSHGLSKMDYAKTLVATLAHLLVHQGDAAGLSLFDRDLQVVWPPSRQKSHLHRMMSILSEIQPNHHKTDLHRSLLKLSEGLKKSSMIFIFSDLWDLSDPLFHLLKVLDKRQSDIVLFHILDPEEVKLFTEGLTVFYGLEEDGEILLDPDEIRASYQELVQAHLQKIRAFCQNYGLDYILIQTHEPFEKALLKLFESRKKIKI